LPSSGQLDSLAAQASYERQCAGKDQYPSASAAEAALRVLVREGLLDGKRGNVHAYRCSFGDHWHFGH
jgi:hypothetical protein